MKTKSKSSKRNLALEEIQITTQSSSIARKPKKTLTVLAESPVRKKKIESKPAVVLARVPAKKKKKSPQTIAKATAERNKEEVKQDEKFLEELDAKVVATDEQEYIKEYLYLYKRLKRLSRKADKNAMLSGKSQDYYAFCTLVSQQREVIADIRSISDLSGQVQMLLESSIQPLVSNIGQVLVNSFYQQRRLLVETCKPEETQFAIKKLDEITNEITKALQMYYEQAATKVHEILVGASSGAPKKKKRK